MAFLVPTESQQIEAFKHVVTEAYGPNALGDWNNLNDLDRAKRIAMGASVLVGRSGPPEKGEMGRSLELTLQPIMVDQLGFDQTWTVNNGPDLGRVLPARQALAMNALEATTLQVDWSQIAARTFGDDTEPYRFEENGPMPLMKKWRVRLDTAETLVREEHESTLGKVSSEKETWTPPSEWRELSERDRRLLVDVARIKLDAEPTTDRTQVNPAAEEAAERTTFQNPRVSGALSALAEGKSEEDRAGLKLLYLLQTSEIARVAGMPRYLFLDTSPKGFSSHGDRETWRIQRALTVAERAPNWDEMTTSQRAQSLHIADLLEATRAALQLRQPEPPLTAAAKLTEN
jgi:hypothetical protein